MTDEWVTTPEAADMLNLSPSRICDRDPRAVLTTMRARAIGGGLLWRVADIRELNRMRHETRLGIQGAARVLLARRENRI